MESPRRLERGFRKWAGIQKEGMRNSLNPTIGPIGYVVGRFYSGSQGSPPRGIQALV